MWWLWALFIIFGSIVAFICYGPDDGSTTSKSNSSTPKVKEKSIDEMIKSLDQNNNISKSSKTSPKKHVDSKQTSDYMPVDPKKYVFEGPLNKLTKYTSDANEDTLYIPMGTRFVGDGEHPIRNRPWDIVYIPRSVIKIDDCALPFVESVYYEGSAEEFAKINKGDLPGSNFMTGFMPNYAESMQPEYQKHAKVKEVKFTFNYNLRDMYQRMAESQKNEHSCVKRARDFIMLCRELDKLGKGFYGFYVVEESQLPTTHLYIKHTFHDVDSLLFAHDSMQKGDDRMVQYYYKKIIDDLPSSINKQDFFLQDYSDFCDFLRGGLVSGDFRYNKLTRDTLNDITIEQHIEVCRNFESSALKKALREEIDRLTK